MAKRRGSGYKDPMDADFEVSSKRKRPNTQPTIKFGDRLTFNNQERSEQFPKWKIEEQNRYLMLELQRQKDIINHQKDDIKCLKDVRERLEEDNVDIDKKQKSTNSEIYKLRLLKRNVENRLEESKDKIRALESENRAFKDDLFRLQPAAQISESDISQRYMDLSERISSWIECEIRLYEKQWSATHDGFPSNSVLFSCGGLPGGAHFLKTFPNFGGEHLLRSAIHYLKWSLNWRSEALKSYAASNAYLEQQKKPSKIVARGIFEALHPLFPLLKENNSAFERFYKQIFSVAVGLVNDIKSSSTQYIYSRPTTVASIFRRRPVTRQGAENMILLDPRTGKKMKNNTLFNAIEPKMVVEQVLMMAPALIRCEPGKNRKWLSKEIVCVDVPPTTVSHRIEVRVEDPIVTSESRSLEVPTPLPSATSLSSQQKEELAVDTNNATIASPDASLFSHDKADAAINHDNASVNSPEASLSGSHRADTNIDADNTTKIQADVPLGDHFQTEAVADAGDTKSVLSDFLKPCDLKTEPTANSDKTIEILD
ncbi:MAG: hypothetical protein Q9167_005458 [Letrouitia subvulpina]